MLHGHHIVITRPIEQAQSLAEGLRARGAIPVLYPGFSFGLPDDRAALDKALSEAAHGQYEILILTSGQTARVIGERLGALSLSLAQQSVWAVGAQTAAACQFEAHIQTPPQAEDAVALLRALPNLRGKRVLLPQSPLADALLAEGLQAAGAEVTVVQAYRILAANEGDDLAGLLRRGLISAFTFFSGSAVEGVLARLEAAGIGLEDVKSIPCVCFGKTTAAKGRALGLRVLEGDTTYETFYRLIEQACPP